jgi:hypothetical protein
MDEDQHTGVSRRSLVKRGACALAGIAIASLTLTRILAAETKLAKSDVQYVDVGKEEGKDCDDCIQFIPGKSPTSPGACKIVEGEISPHGHCIAFTPKPRK